MQNMQIIYMNIHVNQYGDINKDKNKDIMYEIYMKSIPTRQMWGIR